MLGQPRRFPLLEASTRHVAGNAFAPVKLGNAAGDFFVHGPFALLKPVLVGILGSEGIVDHFLNAVEGAAPEPLLDRLFIFGFDFDGSRATYYTFNVARPGVGCKS